MNGKCFEIGTIQAFLDGETTPEVSLRLTRHVAECDGCARLMSTAEEESSLVFSALERELDALVPTQRLWSRINDSIAEEKSSAPFWQKIMLFARMALVNPSLTAAAGVVLVLGMFAAFVSLNDSVDSNIVSSPQTDQPNDPAPADGGTAEIATTADGSAIPSELELDPAHAVTISRLSRKAIRDLAVSVNARSSQHEIKPVTADYRVAAVDSYLPGEESYVKTISDLKENVDTQKDTVMTPSNRVSYERDMAVVNDSIKRMRDVVKKNPRNQAARQVLYSSYQDKIDLLNSVAQREELIASLR